MHRYHKMLEPVTIRGKKLKNRLAASKFGPVYSDFDFDTAYLKRIGENGAAIVTIASGSWPGRDLELLPDGSPVRFPEMMDLTDPAVREKYAGMIRQIQSTGAIVTVSLMLNEPIYSGLSSFDGYEEIMRQGEYPQVMNFRKKEMTTKELEHITDELAWRAKDLHDLGADMVTFYMCYRGSILAQSLSPVLNRRTDRFGGKTMKERATLTRELFAKVRALCGDDILIEIQTSAEEDQPGYTSDDWVEYCCLVQDLVDIVQIRATGCSWEHATGLLLGRETEPPMLKFSRKLKAAGCTLLTAPVTGFSDPDKIEKYLEDGDTDLVVMARRFVSDNDFIRKIRDEAPEDLIPCLRCNECHQPNPSCAVNPKAADMTVYPAPEKVKKVAVIGGGIAGMAAALLCERRGHTVTLYEKSGALGGQLLKACVPDFKWPIRDYLDFVLRKVEASGIRVLLNTEADPDLLGKENYDAVICALGSEPKSIPVEGADQPFVHLADSIFGHEDELGHRVVVIGGADTGREAALHLARLGHEVTMVTRKQAKLWHDNHTQKAEEEAFLHQAGLTYIEHAQVVRIEENSIELSVKRGIPKQVQGFAAVGPLGMGFVPSPLVPESLPLPNGAMMFENGRFCPRPYDETNAVTEMITLPFDSLVVSDGRKSSTEKAEQFRGLAKEYYVIGDCVKPGDIKAANASAYAAAMQI